MHIARKFHNTKAFCQEIYYRWSNTYRTRTHTAHHCTVHTYRIYCIKYIPSSTYTDAFINTFIDSRYTTFNSPSFDNNNHMRTKNLHWRCKFLQIYIPECRKGYTFTILYIYLGIYAACVYVCVVYPNAKKSCNSCKKETKISRMMWWVKEYYTQTHSHTLTPNWKCNEYAIKSVHKVIFMKAILSIFVFSLISFNFWNRFSFKFICLVHLNRL